MSYGCETVGQKDGTIDDLKPTQGKLGKLEFSIFGLGARSRKIRLVKDASLVLYEPDVRSIAS